MADQSEKVRMVLADLDLQYSESIFKQVDEEVAVYAALIPDQLVDKAIGEFSKSMDLRRRENSISVFDVEAFVSTFMTKKSERVAKKSPDMNPLERLVARTEKGARLNKDMIMMAMFATIIALAGLLLDNVAVVIGAMLLSPLLGPINAFAVNTSLGRVRKLASSQLSTLTLLFSVIALSAVATFVISFFFPLNPNTGQIIIRSHANLSDIVTSLVLGLAGGLALFIALPEFLVGVAISVAIVPPATTCGIGIALGDVSLAVGALLLTLLYLVGLQFGCTVMLRLRGVTPRHYYQKKEARQKLLISVAILGTLLTFLALLVIFIPP